MPVTYMDGEDFTATIVGMSRFSDRLKQIAQDRQLSGGQMARICDIPERTYANYAGGLREPDYETLLRICARLGVTPNDLLLDPREDEVPDLRAASIRRLAAAAGHLTDTDIESTLIQLEALAAHRRRAVTG